jgi:hypothetical protein
MLRWQSIREELPGYKNEKPLNAAKAALIVISGFENPTWRGWGIAVNLRIVLIQTIMV